MARRCGGSHLDPVSMERTANFARWRVLLVDCADGMEDRAALCTGPFPAVRKRHAGADKRDPRTKVLWERYLLMQAVVMAYRVCSSSVSTMRDVSRGKNLTLFSVPWINYGRPEIRTSPDWQTGATGTKSNIASTRAAGGWSAKAAKPAERRDTPRALCLRQVPSVLTQLPVKAGLRPAAGRSGFAGALDERYLSVCLRRHRIHLKLYEVTPALASAIKPVGDRRRKATMILLYYV